MPEICRFYGIIIRMYFGDHQPPHFHASYGDDEVLVEILTGAIEGRFPRRALALVMEWLDVNRDALIQNWQLLESDSVPAKIDPLP
jgi:hypothetical protein